ncbi:hypothetical protein [Aeromonas caviae]|uniref:hypothetical protein n=1 Tax=Aeromonas caviae TaxID=648 RepID=UPI002B483525|nr:hypothetical protein [Aeromonas caviae]
MNWTTEHFLKNWDSLLAPMPALLNGLKSPARRSIASAAISAFELRKHVSSCRAWRHKNADQIDKDFMMMVIIPLIRLHPLLSSEGKLMPWNYDYNDRRGPRRSTPDGELEVVKSFLQKKTLVLAEELDEIEKSGNDEKIAMATDVVNNVKLISSLVDVELITQKTEKLQLVYDVFIATALLMRMGIPCAKIDIDAFWINLVATVWGVESSNIHSAARKIKKLFELDDYLNFQLAIGAKAFKALTTEELMIFTTNREVLLTRPLF